MIRIWFLLNCFLLIPGLLFAQSVKFDAEIRSRSELRDGFKAPLAGDDYAAFVTDLRSRINLAYSDEKIDASLKLQDSRIFGQTGTNNTGNSLGFFEAWGAYKFTPKLSVKLGRQVLEYDDKRLFSASNWSNTGNAHDLILLKYESKALKWHSGMAWNNAGDVLLESPYEVARSYKSMAYTWIEKSLDKIALSAIWVNNGFQKGITPDLVNKLIHRNTIGANAAFTDKSSPLYVYATGYHQFGRDASNNKLSAYTLALKTSYNLTSTWTVSLGADYLSGSKSDLEKGKSNTFNKLYGSNHTFNGSMEYWTTPPAQGLRDLYGGIAFKPSAKFDIDLTYHHFALVRNLAETNKKGLGSEIDITANYRVSPQFNIQGGWSAYFKTEQTCVLKNQIDINTRPAHWAYIMITFKPSFL